MQAAQIIPDKWQHQYQPKDEDISADLMTMPILEEWLNVIKQLPKSKANK